MPQFKNGLQKVHTLRKTIVYLSPYLSTMLTFQRSARELILAPDPDPIAESRGLIAEPLFCHSWRHIFGFAPALVASHVYAHSHPALTSLKVALSRHCATILDMRHWHLGAQRSSG